MGSEEETGWTRLDATPGMAFVSMKELKDTGNGAQAGNGLYYGRNVLAPEGVVMSSVDGHDGRAMAGDCILLVAGAEDYRMDCEGMALQRLRHSVRDSRGKWQAAEDLSTLALLNGGKATASYGRVLVVPDDAVTKEEAGLIVVPETAKDARKRAKTGWGTVISSGMDADAEVGERVCWPEGKGYYFKHGGRMLVSLRAWAQASDVQLVMPGEAANDDVQHLDTSIASGPPSLATG